jgi:hypothetical protein
MVCTCFPHWNWKGREGQFIPVTCYTNCDTAELFINGRSVGVRGYEFPRYGMKDRYGNCGAARPGAADHGRSAPLLGCAVRAGNAEGGGDEGRSGRRDHGDFHHRRAGGDPLVGGPDRSEPPTAAMWRTSWWKSWTQQGRVVPLAENEIAFACRGRSKADRRGQWEFAEPRQLQGEPLPGIQRAVPGGGANDGEGGKHPDCRVVGEFAGGRGDAGFAMMSHFFPGRIRILLQSKIVSDRGVPFWLTRFGEANESAKGSRPGVSRLMVRGRQRCGAFWSFQLKPSARIFPGMVWRFAANKMV